MLTGIINSYRINVEWSDEDECYVVRVPKLKGCVTHGDTLEKTMKNAQEVVDLWLASARKHGDRIPATDI